MKSGTPSTSSISSLRITAVNTAPIHAERDYILYWMIAQRRRYYNFSLQRAVEWAHQLKRPIVVLEALRVGYQWASERLHGFVIQGMASNYQHYKHPSVYYYPYLEAKAGDGKGLLEALAKRACMIVTDEFPCFFLHKMVQAAAAAIPVRMEQIDANGLLPLRAADRTFPTAYAFRRFLQRTLAKYLLDFPASDPLSNTLLPKAIIPQDAVRRRWNPVRQAELDNPFTHLAGLAIDRNVSRAMMHGGYDTARSRWHHFVEHGLPRYAEERNQPEIDVSSGMSPYLHFGHIGTHQLVDDLLQRENWGIERLNIKANGSRQGWWGLPENHEAFLDELITWREVGYNFCHREENYDHYESLPEWARKTMHAHLNDPRPHRYSLEQFDTGKTHDPLWNAAQMQLKREGRLHNYLRMLWGKKILEWSPTPQEALAIMIELNNQYAVDGRNPNSYSGIFWVLGRYDRAWGPEREIFGKIRYMSSENTARKVRVKRYIKTYLENEQLEWAHLKQHGRLR